MIRRILSLIQRVPSRLVQFRAKEDGNASLEFALIIPVMLMIVFSSVELGLIMLRQVMLERAMDLTVRDIRLGTGGQMQHDDIRDTICARSGFIEDCATSLRLEMVRVDPFVNDINIDATPDCVQSVEEVDPIITFENGDSNDLMFLRACQSFEPVFPYWGLADSMQKHEGRIRIYASSAFVQEPK